MQTEYYSGLASLIKTLWHHAESSIRELPISELNLLKSECEAAHISLNGIATVAALGLMAMGKNEREENFIPYKTQDFMITNAETSDAIFSISQDLHVYANNKAKGA